MNGYARGTTVQADRSRAEIERTLSRFGAAASGITTVEHEWLAHFVLPGGQTVTDWLKPQIDHIYANGKWPTLLTMGDGKK